MVPEGLGAVSPWARLRPWALVPLVASHAAGVSVDKADAGPSEAGRGDLATPGNIAAVVLPLCCCLFGLWLRRRRKGRGAPHAPLGAGPCLKPRAVHHLAFDDLVTVALEGHPLDGEAFGSDVPDEGRGPRSAPRGLPRGVARDPTACPEALAAAAAREAARAALRAQALPAYEDGEPVEYFSQSHSRWIAGRVHSDVLQGDRLGLTYSVSIKTRSRTQLREHVGLDELRAPFRAEDLVEVYFAEDGGMWAPAVVDGEQGVHSWTAAHGYRVSLCRDGRREASQRISAVRLRRRFPEGFLVQLYRGPTVGWVAAVVDRTAELDGDAAGAWVTPRLVRSSTSASVTSALSGASGAASQGGRASPQVPHGPGDSGLWDALPVRVLGEKRAMMTKAFLLRAERVADAQADAAALAADLRGTTSGGEVPPERPPSAWRASVAKAARAAQTLALGEEVHERVHPFLEHGSVVEYFSTTHRCWMPARLQVEVVRGTLLDPPTIKYGVLLRSGAVGSSTRRNIGLNRIRVPIGEEELVEVFSRSSGSRWLPAMTSRPRSGSSLSVRLLDASADRGSGRCFDHVAGVRLRRRFPCGSRVKVYKGPLAGWTPAVVERSFEASPSCSPRSESPRDASPKKSALARAFQRAAKGSRSLSVSFADEGRAAPLGSGHSEPCASQGQALSERPPLVSLGSGISGGSSQASLQRPEEAELVALSLWSKVFVREVRTEAKMVVPSCLVQLTTQLEDLTTDA